MQPRAPDDLDVRTLLSVANALGSTLDLEHLLQVVLEQITGLLDAERALCALLDARGHVQRAVVRNLAWDGPGTPLPISQNVLSSVFKRRIPVMSSDALGDEGLSRHASVRLLGLRLVVAVPLVVQGRCRGVLYVDSTAKVFTEATRKKELLVAIAKLVATAIENAELFEEQRYRARLLAELVHDLRSPLTVLSAGADQFRASWPPKGTEGLEILDDMEASTARMVRMIDATLEASRADAGAQLASPGAVDVVGLLQRHFAKMRVVARAQGVQICLHAPAGLPRAVTIADQVLVAIDNLLFNALKHAPPGTAIDVSVAPRETQRPNDIPPVAYGVDYLVRHQHPLSPDLGSPFLEVSFCNDGEPIPEALIPRIFSPFVRGSGAAGEHKSTGLGLSIVAQCVSNLGGGVWVTSSQDAGTRFSFTLPTRLVGREEPERA
jgi:signal transduction histidine kinase